MHDIELNIQRMQVGVRELECNILSRIKFPFATNISKGEAIQKRGVRSYGEYY